MGKTIYCLSNGSPTEFPDNTLTNFGNKLPVFYDFHKLENFRFHIALESIGFSTVFERNFLPNSKFNPSIILVTKNTDPLQNSKVPSKCLTFDENDSKNCYIVLLDLISTAFDKQQLGSYVYIFLEPTDLTYEKLSDFLLKLKDHVQVVTSKNDNQIKIEGKTPITLWMNFKLLDYLHTELQPKQAFGNVLYQEHMENLKTLDYREQHSITMNGDKYCHFRLDENYSDVVFDLSNLLKPKLPKIIKVRCVNIRDQIFDEEKSKDLVVFCPEISTTDRFFFHEFESKTYCVLENTLLNTVNFILVDENNEQLNLKTGIPTILKLNIEAMPKYNKSFNVRVTSAKQSNHPDNTRSMFKVTLPQTLFLDSNWKVAVSSVNLPNVFNTFIDKSITFTFIYRDAAGAGKKIEYFLPIKHLTKEEFLNEMNFFFKKNNDNIDIGEVYEAVPPGGYEKVLVIKLKHKGSLRLQRQVTDLIGYTGSDFKMDKKNFTFLENKPFHEFYMNNPINMDYFKPTYFMLYSKIVEPTAVSGIFLNILKIFPVSQTDSTYVIQEFKHREYLSLSNSDIKEVDFELRSHSGEFIEFNSRNTDMIILNLHFTNYS